WIPPQGYNDLSDSSRVVHVWQASDLSAYVSLILKEADVGDSDSFKAAVADYKQHYYQNNTLTGIDEETAPDGTIRQSYRLVGATQPAFPPGQLDVFFLRRAPYLAVVEMYSADSTGNTMVRTFQQILDSVDIKTS